MVSVTETGHAKNVANFNDLLSSVKGYGEAYNPSKASIKLTALLDLSADARNVLNALNSAWSLFRNAAAAREAAFEPLSKFATRVLNALKATDSSSQVDETAKSLVRKIQGRRATPKMTAEEKKAASEDGKEVVEISASQMSYDNRMENLDKLIKLLGSIDLYAPNEADLKVSALTALLNDLKEKNAAVVSASTSLSNARITRNNILYKPNTGMVDIAMDTKTYIKSVFGANSPQYRQVSKLKFSSAK